MPAIIARLIASIVLMLSLPVLCAALVVAYDEIFGLHRGNELVNFGLILVICAAVAMIGWVALWYSQVRWTRRRIVATCALVIGITIAASAFGTAMALVMGRFGEIPGMFFGSIIWGLAWFGLTPWVWKETRAERSARLQRLGPQALACPVCGYNLTGLREARCPECGASYTLDQLYAAMSETAEPVER
jgi:hypothetical protein